MQERERKPEHEDERVSLPDEDIKKIVDGVVSGLRKDYDMSTYARKLATTTEVLGGAPAVMDEEVGVLPAPVEGELVGDMSGGVPARIAGVVDAPTRVMEPAGEGRRVSDSVADVMNSFYELNAKIRTLPGDEKKELASVLSRDPQLSRFLLHLDMERL